MNGSMDMYFLMANLLVLALNIKIYTEMVKIWYHQSREKEE